MNKLVLIGLGIAATMLTSSRNVNTNKRQALVDYVNRGGDAVATKLRAKELFLNKMSEAEIADVYRFIFDYIKKGKGRRQMPAALNTRIAAIGRKYNIFT